MKKSTFIFLVLMFTTLVQKSVALSPMPFSRGDVECSISNLVFEVTDCVDGTFSVDVNFDYQENLSNFFTITYFDNENNVLYEETYEYTDLPVSLDFENEFSPVISAVVVDTEDPDCAADGQFENPCAGSECTIYSIDFGPNPVCEDGFIVTDWYIFSENTSETGFDIFINEVFIGFVEYNNDGPYEIEIENPGTEVYSITACDNDNPDCCFSWTLENPCYEEEECTINEVSITELECIDGELVLFLLDFEYAGTTSASFDYEINGQQSNGTISFADLPVYIEFVVVENTPFITVEINENDNPECGAITEFENPCYEEGGECFISEIEAEITACEEEDFDILINFEYENTSDQFVLVGNGVTYGTFLYADLPITLTTLNADCTTFYEFVATDVENPECSNVIEFGEVCCEDFNGFDEISIEYTEDSLSFSVTINVESLLLPDCEIKVYMGDELIVILDEENTSFVLGPFDCGTDQAMILTIENSCSEEVLELELDLSDFECTTTSILEPSLDIDFSWNAISNQMEVNTLENLTLDIRSIDGRRVYIDHFIRGSQVIDLENLPTGIYIAHFVRGSDHKSTTYKFLNYR